MYCWIVENYTPIPHLVLSKMLQVVENSPPLYTKDNALR